MFQIISANTCQMICESFNVTTLALGAGVNTWPVVVSTVSRIDIERLICLKNLEHGSVCKMNQSNLYRKFWIETTVIENVVCMTSWHILLLSKVTLPVKLTKVGLSSLLNGTNCRHSNCQVHGLNHTIWWGCCTAITSMFLWVF